SSEEIKALIGPAELHIGFHRDTVVSLHKWVHGLSERNSLSGFKAFFNVFSRVKFGQGKSVSHFANLRKAKFGKPLGVVVDFGLSLLQNLVGLSEVAFHVRFHLLARKHRSLTLLVRSVSNSTGKVSHDEVDFTAQILKIAKLQKRHCAAEMQIGTRRINS